MKKHRNFSIWITPYVLIWLLCTLLFYLLAIDIFPVGEDNVVQITSDFYWGVMIIFPIVCAIFFPKRLPKVHFRTKELGNSTEILEPSEKPQQISDLEEKDEDIDLLRAQLQEREKAIEGKEMQLQERENSISIREREYKRLVSEEIEKKAKESKEKLRQDADTAQYHLEELKKYKLALHETEFKIIDWLNRVDKKEQSAFDEIKESVKAFKEYNQMPLEDGYGFENLVAQALIQNGFSNVTTTGGSGDFGADVVAEKDGMKYVIQCKYYSSSVGVKAVQEVFSSKIHYRAHIAVVATNSVFTKAAKTLAEETGVLLWDGRGGVRVKDGAGLLRVPLQPLDSQLAAISAGGPVEVKGQAHGGILHGERNGNDRRGGKIAVLPAEGRGPERDTLPRQELKCAV